MFSGWWAASAYEVGGPALVAAWIFWVVISIMFHELAHGYAAVGRGDQTPVYTGHMTFNPIVHMGPQSLIMLAVLGIAWGAMPIDPTRMKGKYSEAWVAFAGPLTNFLIAIICILGGGVAVAMMTLDQRDEFLQAPFHMLKGGTQIAPKLAIFAGVGAMLNVGLGVFNLFPLPPLDGSRILANFVPPYRRFLSSDSGRVTGLIALVLAFFFAGSIIIPIGKWTTIFGMALVAFVLRLLGVGP